MRHSTCFVLLLAVAPLARAEVGNVCDLDTTECGSGESCLFASRWDGGVCFNDERQGDICTPGKPLSAAEAKDGWVCREADGGKLKVNVFGMRCASAEAPEICREAGGECIFPGGFLGGDPVGVCARKDQLGKACGTLSKTDIAAGTTCMQVDGGKIKFTVFGKGCNLFDQELCSEAGGTCAFKSRWSGGLCVRNGAVGGACTPAKALTAAEKKKGVECRYIDGGYAKVTIGKKADDTGAATEEDLPEEEAPAAETGGCNAASAGGLALAGFVALRRRARA